MLPIGGGITAPRCHLWEAHVNGDVTEIFDAMDRGDPVAAGQLLPLVYDELRRLANRQLTHESPDLTLQATALVHEAYMRLVGNTGGDVWKNRRHFFGAAAEAMRRILIQEARRRASQKRGGSYRIVSLPDDIPQRGAENCDSLLALDEALRKLEVEDRDSYQLVMLRYFGGLTVEEAAETLGISPRTVKRHWSFARAWLQREMERPESS